MVFSLNEQSKFECQRKTEITSSTQVCYLELKGVIPNRMALMQAIFKGFGLGNVNESIFV